MSLAVDVVIVGGGLAGSEAAWQLLQRGWNVALFEMRPQQKTPAHQGGHLAELVCSNSFRGADLKNAVGLLKEEMRTLDSLILEVADRHAIPGGGALVLDREGFSEEVTCRLSSHPRLTLCREEVTSLAKLRDFNAPILLASGPLTSEALSAELRNLTDSQFLYFYDSIAPIVSAESIDREFTFSASRWGKGGGDDYLNCPLNREQYESFVEALLEAEKVPCHEFDVPKFFEGCLPIEVMAERGKRALAFGPMKPAGLTDPRTGRWPYAVLQLRQDDLHAQLYNLVGFQTRMKYPEQKRVFSMIPALRQAEFVRLGSMHRNTFINAPALLNEYLELRDHPGIFLAGQMIGVEGYVESAAIGLYAGFSIAKRLVGESLQTPPPITALGALLRHLLQANPKGFQPMNINFGLFELPQELARKEQRLALAERSLAEIRQWKLSQALGNQTQGTLAVSSQKMAAEHECV